jgi:hypothetical protein
LLADFTRRFEIRTSPCFAGAYGVVANCRASRTQNDQTRRASPRGFGRLILVDIRIGPDAPERLKRSRWLPVLRLQCSTRVTLRDYYASEEGFLMRQRLQRFLPVVLFAVVVQILAPIGACWAPSIAAAADPLQLTVVCHDGAANNQDDQTGQPRAHDGCCSVCSVVHTGGPVGTPHDAIAGGYGAPQRVVWLETTPDLLGSRPGSHAQARAPPSIS